MESVLRALKRDSPEGGHQHFPITVQSSLSLWESCLEMEPPQRRAQGSAGLDPWGWAPWVRIRVPQRGARTSQTPTPGLGRAGPDLAHCAPIVHLHSVMLPQGCRRGCGNGSRCDPAEVERGPGQ